MPFRLRHPAADAHDRVDVNGTSIELGDDGEFEAPESWARRWCDANGYDLDDVRTDVYVAIGNPSELTVDELQEELPKVYDISNLKTAREFETKHKNRTTALEAIDDRIAELED